MTEYQQPRFELVQQAGQALQALRSNFPGNAGIDNPVPA